MRVAVWVRKIMKSGGVVEGIQLTVVKKRGKMSGLGLYVVVIT